MNSLTSDRRAAAGRAGQPGSSRAGPPEGLAALQERAVEAAALLKALAHPDRLMLLCQLVQCERSVSELGLLAGVRQPSLSQQLGVLRGEHLVATRRAGKSMLYRIASPTVQALLETLYREFCEPHPAAAPERRAGIFRKE